MTTVPGRRPFWTRLASERGLLARDSRPVGLSQQRYVKRHSSEPIPDAQNGLSACPELSSDRKDRLAVLDLLLHQILLIGGQGRGPAQRLASRLGSCEAGLGVLLHKFADAAEGVFLAPLSLNTLAGSRSVPALLHAVTSGRSSCPAPCRRHVRQDALRP